MVFKILFKIVEQIFTFAMTNSFASYDIHVNCPNPKSWIDSQERNVNLCWPYNLLPKGELEVANRMETLGIPSNDWNDFQGLVGFKKFYKYPVVNHPFWSGNKLYVLTLIENSIRRASILSFSFSFDLLKCEYFKTGTQPGMSGGGGGEGGWYFNTEEIHNHKVWFMWKCPNFHIISNSNYMWNSDINFIHGLHTVIMCLLRVRTANESVHIMLILSFTCWIHKLLMVIVTWHLPVLNFYLFFSTYLYHVNVPYHNIIHHKTAFLLFYKVDKIHLNKPIVGFLFLSLKSDYRCNVRLAISTSFTNRYITLKDSISAKPWMFNSFTKKDTHESFVSYGFKWIVVFSS